MRIKEVVAAGLARSTTQGVIRRVDTPAGWVIIATN